MRHLRSILLGAAALALLSVGDLAAQRRGTSGGGSDTRGTPSGSSGRSAGSGSSRSGGSSSGGSTRATPSRGSSRDGGTTASVRGEGSSSSTRPASGKIASVRRNARTGTPTRDVVIIDRGVYLGNCWDCNYWGYYRGRYGWYHGGWWYPPRDRYYDEEEVVEDAAGGMGYLPYPYAERDGTGETFVKRRTTRRSSYGAVSGQYFSDVGSTTVAGRFGIEGAFKAFRVEAEYAQYAEPLVDRTDRLSTFRIGLGFQPQLGNTGYAIAGIGARTVSLHDGTEAGGIEGQLGVQLLPLRPIGLGITGRVADMRWDGMREHFTLREVNTTASVFVGRIEIQGGWHWLKLGDAPAFAGPMIGTRLWF